MAVDQLNPLPPGSPEFKTGAAFESAGKTAYGPIKKGKAFDTARVVRLSRAMNWSRNRTLWVRTFRQQFIRQYVGKWYGDESVDHDAVPVNYMELAIDIYCQQLAAHNPRASISTDQQDLRASALSLKTGLNYLVGKMNLQKQLYKCVKEALFCFGVMKVGLCQTAIDNNDDPGEPFAKCVSIDDFGWDIFAREPEEFNWSGNRYILTLDQVRDNPNFDKKVRQNVHPLVRTSYNEQGDPKAQAIGQGFTQGQDADLYDMVELWDVWLPKEKLIVTLTADQFFTVNESSQVLRVMEWEGPDHGPYHFLGYFWVPDNVIPLSMAAMLYDLNSLANNLHNKLADQARRQKTNTVYRGASGDDALRERDAGDGEMVRSDDPGGTKEVARGGPDPKNQAYLLQVKQDLNKHAGNLDAIGGLAPQSQTAKQDSMLDEAAGARVREMQQTTIDFASKILRDLSWYLFTDPLIDIPLTKEIGSGTSVNFRLNQASMQRRHGMFYYPLTKQQEKGQFLDYNFSIEPFSMQPKTPGSRLATLERFLGVLQPMLPAMMQQGMQIDYEAIARLWAEWADMKEIDQVIRFGGESSVPQEGPVGEAPPMKMSAAPANKTTTTTRFNRPGMTQEGVQNAQLMQLIGSAAGGAHGQQMNGAA